MIIRVSCCCLQAVLDTNEDFIAKLLSQLPFEARSDVLVISTCETRLSKKRDSDHMQTTVLEVGYNKQILSLV